MYYRRPAVDEAKEQRKGIPPRLVLRKLCAKNHTLQDTSTGQSHLVV